MKLSIIIPVYNEEKTILSVINKVESVQLQQGIEKEIIVVFDRDIGYGYEGVLCYELKSALYGLKKPPFIKGFIVGLGGRDVTNEHITDGVNRALNQAKTGEISQTTEFLGLKLDQLSNYDESTFFEEGKK